MNPSALLETTSQQAVLKLIRFACATAPGQH